MDKAGDMAEEMALIIGIPHSGRNLQDAALMGCGHWTKADHESFADPYLDVLADGLQPWADGIVVQDVARSLVDMNRCPGDQTELCHCLCGGILHRDSVGLGLMPKRVTSTRILDRHEHDVARRRALILHAQYHDALAKEIKKNSHKMVLVMELHSMPSRSGKDIGWCVGNRHGTSSAPWALNLMVDLLTTTYPDELVAANKPFAGLYSAWRHGRPAENIHFIQLEANRQLIGTTPEEVTEHLAKLQQLFGQAKKEGSRRSPKFNREETPS